MKTRFKVLSVLGFFLISFSFMLFVFSPEGFIANKMMEKRLEEVTKEIKEREGELNALRIRSEGENITKEGNRDYVYYFPDDGIFDPVTKKDVITAGEWEGMSREMTLLWAFSLTGLYAVIIFVIVPGVKRRKKWRR